MEFTIVTKNKKKGDAFSVSIPKTVLDEVISLLSNVDCTCVWSPRDNEYIKVNDIPQSLLDELRVARKLSENSL